MANMAAKRAAKANRRKAVVAERRKAEALATSPAGRARQAAAFPIQHCLVQEGLFGAGLGTLILARGLTPDRLTMGVFLIDVFYLGVKNAMIKTLGAEEFEYFTETMGETSPLVPVEPAYARKLLREVVAWAASHGIPPHRDFAPAEQLFGNVDAAACAVAFQFGLAGKPYYIPGPFESGGELHRQLAQLGEGTDDVGAAAELD